MPGLPEVMRCVADKIINDDWFESQSPDGSQSFYVIGAEAYWDDVQSGGSYTPCLVAPGPSVGPLADHVIRSQVAGSRREEYLKRERQRLERSGVSPGAIDRFIGGDSHELSSLLPESMSFEKGLDFLLPFFEALRVTVGATNLDHEEAQEIAAVREKLCLRELVAKYAKIVDRWGQLDQFPF